MMDTESQAYRLLYCDDSGETVGLEEVQLLDPWPTDRLGPLRTLLVEGDPTARFHSMLVLVAWGDSVGLEAANRFLHNKQDDASGISTHRLHGRNLAYDELADALGLSLANNVDRAEVTALAVQLLQLFRTEFFESGLERLLSALADPELQDEILRAIGDVSSQGRVQEASELLPALASINPDLTWRTIHNMFSNQDGYLPEALTGIAFAFGRIKTSEALEELYQFQQSDQPGAAVAAEMALRLYQRGR